MPPERTGEIPFATLDDPDVESVNNAEKTYAIRRAIAFEEKKLRAKYPVLQHQDAIGFALWAGSISCVVVNAWLYTQGYTYWWASLIFAAMCISVLHELEHDLIHFLYFKKQSIPYNLMMLGIWVSKLSLNPFVRRDLHLWHHKRSGQRDDIEERLLGLGVPNHLFRILSAFCPSVSLLYIYFIQKDVPWWSYRRGSPCTTSPRKFLAFLGQQMDNVMIGSPLTIAPLAAMGYGWAQTAMVVWIGPNILRHACLALASSYSHYYGDLTPGDVTMQNQILNHWALFPIQLFCFNFAAEHIIHHYVVSQPFYIRHMVRHAAWKAMQENGVRVNDWATVWRANRYGPWTPKNWASVKNE